MTGEKGAAPAVTVVIPALDAVSTLRACIDAILRSNCPIAEIVLFDDGSGDATGTIAADMGVRVIRNDGAPLGPGEGRNRAALTCETPLLAFVDADVVVHPDAIALLAAAFDADGIVAAFGSYDDRPPARHVAGQYANLRHHYFHQQAPPVTRSFWAGLGMVRREAFLACGGFDRSYHRPSIEDIELGARMTAGGGRIRVIPEAQATHLKEPGLRQLWQTDIVCRAMPWARLIARGKSSGADLNGSARETVAAAFAWLTAACLAAILVTPWAATASCVAAIPYFAANRRFFGFLARHLKGLHLAGAVLLHWLYHLYASAIFGVILAGHAFRARSA